MDKKILQKFNMFTNVDKVLKTHTKAVDMVPALVGLRTQFGDMLTSIGELMRPLMLSNRGVAKDKQDAKEKLVGLLAAICGALKAYAASINSQALYEKSNYAKSSLMLLRASELQATAATLSDLANAHSASLLSYGVTSAELTALNGAVQRFGDENPKVRQVKVARKTERHTLFALVGATNELLRDRMDNAVRILGLSEKEFCELYFNARRNYIVSIRHQQQPETAPEGAEANAEVSSLADSLREFLARIPTQKNATNGHLAEVEEV